LTLFTIFYDANRFYSQIESDDDVQQVKDAEMIGNIDEIIGVNTSLKKDSDEGAKTPGKTSIMTTSTGKTLKRKHDEIAAKTESDDICTITEGAAPEKKIATEQPEITITPIPKVTESEKTNGKATEA